MVTVKKLLMVIAGAVFSTSSLGLEAAHAHLGHSPSEAHIGGSQGVLLVPPDATGRESFYLAGDRYDFLATGEETGGQFSLFDFFVPQGGGPQVLHFHEREDESFYILEGELTVYMEDQIRVATPGTFVYLPKNRPHRFQNLGTTPARTLSLTTPSGLEDFFREAGQPVTDKSAPPPPQDLETQLANVLISAEQGIQSLPNGLPSGYTPPEGVEDFLLVPPGAPGRESVSIADALYTSIATVQETDGHFTLFDVFLPPQAGPELLQSNREEDQSFYVLEGEVTFQFEDQTAVGTPGTLVYLPEGTPYSYQNLGTAPARTLSLRTSTPVPEPSSWLGILGFGACVGASLVRKRKHKKQKSANLDTSTGTV